MAPALMFTLSNYWPSGEVKQLSFYFFLLSSRILFCGILPWSVYPLPNCRTSGLFSVFGNYEYSGYRCLHSLGLSSVLGPINLGLGLTFPQHFCPSFLICQPKYALDLLQISTLYQYGILGWVGFLSLPQWLKAFAYERRIWGCRWDFVPVPRGSISLLAHLRNQGVSL